MNKQPTIPAHISTLSVDDQDIWLAWQECGGTEDDTIDEAKEALRGIYQDEKDAAQTIGQEYLDNEGVELPAWLAVDWRTSWECDMRHDFNCTSYEGQFYVFYPR